LCDDVSALFHFLCSFRNALRIDEAATDGF
jgi:hypothetical protein